MTFTFDTLIKKQIEKYIPDTNVLRNNTKELFGEEWECNISYP